MDPVTSAASRPAGSSTTGLKVALSIISGVSGAVVGVVGLLFLMTGSCMSSAGQDVARNDQIGTGTVLGGGMELGGAGAEVGGVAFLVLGGVLLLVAIASLVSAVRDRAAVASQQQATTGG